MSGYYIKFLNKHVFVSFSKIFISITISRLAIQSIVIVYIVNTATSAFCLIILVCSNYQQPEHKSLDMNGVENGREKFDRVSDFLKLPYLFKPATFLCKQSN